MLQSYFTIALRNLLRRKIFTAISIVGLSIGLACCLLMVMYIKDELSFDRFHANKEHLYRLTCDVGEREGKREVMGLASMVHGPSFKEGIPEIQDFVRVRERESLLKIGNTVFNEKFSWVDNNFFRVFAFSLVSGDASKVLSGLQSAVVTEEIAMKYFGTTNVLGKRIEIEVGRSLESFIISGVAKNPPENSSIQFGVLLPFQFYAQKDNDPTWLMLSYSTYFRLSPNANLATVTSAMERIYREKAEKEIAMERKSGWKGEFVWGLQPMTAIHLDANVAEEGTARRSNPLYSLILGGIALVMLALACINFINLSIGQSLRRSKEIGIRKVIGGARKQVAMQFLTESFVQTAIAFALAFCLAELVLPMFNEVSGKHLALAYLADTTLVLSFIGVLVGTAFLAGLYPAILISRLEPAETLFARTILVKRGAVAKSLIVAQFVIATTLAMGTLVVYQQCNFLTTKDVGYNDRNLLVLNVPNAQDMQKMQLYKTEFGKLSGVESIAPRTDIQFGTTARANSREIGIVYEHIDQDFIRTMGVTLAKGRNFSPNFASDSTESVLVNEAFVRAAGWNDAVGKTVDFLNGKERRITIIGVIKDYHFGSLKNAVQPQLFTFGRELPFGQFLLRLNGANIAQTLALVEKTYRAIIPLRPFQYHFQHDVNVQGYKAEERWRTILTLAAAFTMFISSIGLLGLTLLATEQRTKEIGIRKVLGASVVSIIALLSKDFLKLVGIAIVLATPLAYWAAGKWLQDFAYRVELSWWVFASAGMVAVVIAFMTVAAEAWRSARANPVKSLRSE